MAKKKTCKQKVSGYKRVTTRCKKTAKKRTVAKRKTTKKRK